MQHKFIQTTNYINCLEAMKELARLPRDMEKMGLFYGNAGRGKSLIIEKLAIDEGAALVRTLGSWTPKLQRGCCAATAHPAVPLHAAGGRALEGD